MLQRRHLTVVATVVLACTLVLLGPCAASLAQAAAEDASSRAIAAALQWLRGQQAADGSFGGSTGNTIEVVLAIAAAGQDPASWRAADGRSATEYLVAQAGQYAVDAATTGKLMVAVVAAGLDPRDVGGLDLEAKLRGYDDGQGVFADGALAQAWAVLGLSAADGPIPPAAAAALTALQQPDGGWEGAAGWGTDSNTTALVVQALRAAGRPSDDAALAKARTYLQAQLAPDGGLVYSSQFGKTPDANSTAYGIQGLLALGEDPTGADWARAGRSPLDALLTFQIESGAFEWQKGEGANLLATAQAVPALARVTYPLRAARPATADVIALDDGQAISGTLAGRRGGAHALYRLAHPGGGREVAIEVRTPAAHPLVLAGFGFNVYGPSGERLGGGAAVTDSLEHVLRFAATSDTPAEWSVQVYNYVEGTSLPYSLVARGMAALSAAPATPVAPAPEAAPSAQADDVPLLTDTVRGVLVGDRAGAYARYRLPVPSAGEDVTVYLRFTPDDPVVSRGLGFTVYAPLGEATAGAPTGAPGERVAYIAAANAGEYLIQVHNYLGGVTMEYVLSR